MISHYDKHFEPRFDRGNWSGPRSIRGHQRPTFSHGRPGQHTFATRGSQPTAEQQALRSTAVEVARLFVIAARTARGNGEKQGQLRAFLERSRTELSNLIDGSSQQPQQANADNAPEVDQA
jgi:hypothetical protein